MSIQLKRPYNYVPEDGARFIASFSKARVRTADLSLIADVEFKLTTGNDGMLRWNWGDVKHQTCVEVLHMMHEGYEGQGIAETLDVSKGRVSQI